MKEFLQKTVISGKRKFRFDLYERGEQSTFLHVIFLSQKFPRNDVGVQPKRVFLAQRVGIIKAHHQSFRTSPRRRKWWRWRREALFDIGWRGRRRGRRGREVGKNEGLWEQANIKTSSSRRRPLAKASQLLSCTPVQMCTGPDSLSGSLKRALDRDVPNNFEHCIAPSYIADVIRSASMTRHLHEEWQHQPAKWSACN